MLFCSLFPSFSIEVPAKRFVRGSLVGVTWFPASGFSKRVSGEGWSLSCIWESGQSLHSLPAPLHLRRPAPTGCSAPPGQIGSVARQEDILPKAEIEKAKTGSTIFGKTGAHRRGTAISQDDKISLLRKRRAETKDKAQIFWGGAKAFLKTDKPPRNYHNSKRKWHDRQPKLFYLANLIITTIINIIILGFFRGNIYLLRSVLVGPLLLFQARLFLNHVQCWPSLFKQDTESWREARGEQWKWLKAEKYCLWGEAEEIGAIQPRKEKVKRQHNGFQISGRILQRLWHAAVQCFLGDSDGPELQLSERRRAPGRFTTHAACPLWTRLCGVQRLVLEMTLRGRVRPLGRTCKEARGRGWTPRAVLHGPLDVVGGDFYPYCSAWTKILGFATILKELNKWFIWQSNIQLEEVNRGEDFINTV